MRDIVLAPSPNHGPRADNLPVDMLVLHYTGMPDGSSALDWLCRRESQVSAHYLVEEDGQIIQLVAEDRRAWHAGKAAWRGHQDVNGRSIGIEIVNPGHDYGYRAFPATQMQAVMTLCRDILRRHPIPARNVVGHSDVAPSRKRDPGELFPWQELAAANIGLWPQPAPAVTGSFAALMRDFGYDLANNPLASVTSAMQRHFRPARVDGVVDDETHRIAQALLDLVAVAGDDA